jgi:predicted amidohydrolase
MNAVVGGFAQNVETLSRFRKQAAGFGADLVLTPELSLMGYPPEDLLH